MKIAAAFAFIAALGTGAVCAPALADDIAPTALNSLTAAPAHIVAAPVLDQNGRTLGKVQRLVTDQNGRPAAISYAGSNGLVVVSAAAVSYDQQKNILVTDSSAQQLARN